MVPHVELPMPGRGNWFRVAWSGPVAPGESFSPVKIGRELATVTATITGRPAGAKIRFQHSADGKKGWADLDSRPAAFFRHTPGDTVEFRGLTGWVRPALNTKTSGQIGISVTVAPLESVHSMTGAVA